MAVAARSTHKGCSGPVLPIGRAVCHMGASQSSSEREHYCEQVCPAGWKPGESTMKPDPKGKLDYFAAL